MRRTKQLVKVAAALMAEPDRQHYGFELMLHAKVSSGVLYPILARMLGEGWLADAWQNPADMEKGQRLPRRYYTITDKGRVALSELTVRRRR